jgi:photosystem II stability/assembly factor-like uncharacterized protein
MRGMRMFVLIVIAGMLCAVTEPIPRLAVPSMEPRAMTFASSAADDLTWTVQTSGTDTNFRGISAANTVDANGAEHITVWASGSNGVILFSSDLGKTWKRIHVAEGDSLDFRSIVAFDAKHAYVMSSGNGNKSRIYETNDGGETWKLEFAGRNPTLFLDALVCRSECYALSDPVDGKFVVFSTQHRKNWKELASDGMPAALPGEGAFAASGTALAIDPDGEIYFGTGGGKVARVFHSVDKGKTWTATETPILSGNASSGIFSILANGDDVVVAGGNYKDPNSSDRVAAYSRNLGRTWTLAAQQPSGYRSTVVSMLNVMIAVGPNGEDLSRDRGVHWKPIESLDLNAIFILDFHNGWAVGAKGTIAHVANRFECNDCEGQ